MARPVKWSRDLHLIRNQAVRSKTETWSRQEIENLFGVSRPSAQNLMKAIGEVQTIGAAHFVDRASLVDFLTEMIAADSVETALRARLASASPPPHKKPLRIAIPHGLRLAMLPDLVKEVSLSPGRIEIVATSPAGLIEALASLALVMQNDFDRWEQVVSLPTSTTGGAELEDWLAVVRHPRDR